MQDLIGKKLGQYEIRGKIGQGGMASVFKAYQANLNRFVAIKILSQNLMSDPALAKRFQREAHAVAQLNHPNILQVYDFGVQDDFHFIVMRYVEDSTTLRDLIEQDPPMETLISYMVQVSDALSYAHDHGIIHRDIKPSNILIDGKWALLSDFGLVKDQATTSHLTNTGTGMGTPAYMSPEQARGHETDHRTDIYALGVILHKMLTKTIPHDAPTPLAIMLKRTTEPVVPLSQLKPDIPRSLEYVTMRALAQRPDERYSTAVAFAEALEKAFKDPNYVEEETIPSLLDAEQTVVADAANGAEITMPSTGGISVPDEKTTPPVNKRLFIGGGIAAIALVTLLLAGSAFLTGEESTPTPASAPTEAANTVIETNDDEVSTTDDETAAAIATPPPDNTPTPVPLQTPQVMVNEDVEVWSGPGEGYQLLGFLPSGASAEIISRDESGNWWQIKTGLGSSGVGWVSADDELTAASNAGSIAIAVAPPTFTPTVTPTETPAPPTATPTASPSPTASSTSTPAPATPTSAIPPSPTSSPTPALPAGEIMLLEPDSLEEPSFGMTEFEWQWSGPLPAEHGFEVRVWQEGEAPAGVHNSVLDNQDGTVQALGNSTYRLEADITEAAGVRQRSGTYNWTVLLVQISPEYKELGIQAPAGQLRFELPSSGGGGGDGGGGGGGGFN